MPTAFGTKIPGQLVTSAWANLVGSSINAIEDGNAMSLSQILAKYTGTPNGTKFLRDDGSWQNATTTDASALTSGTLPLARLSGITTTELSASAGIVSGQIAGVALDKLTAGTLGTTLALGTQVITSTGSPTWYTATSNSIKMGVNSVPMFSLGFAHTGTVADRWALGRYGTQNDITQAGISSNSSTAMALNVAATGTISFKVNNSELLAIGKGGGSPGADRWALGGFGLNAYSSTTSGIVSYAATVLDMGIASGGSMKKYFANVEKYRFSAALCEFDRLSLGGTIGSSVDPGAGGLSLVGGLEFNGIVANSATKFMLSKTASNGAILGVPASAYVGIQHGGTLSAIFGISAGSVGAHAFELGNYNDSTHGRLYSNGDTIILNSGTTAYVGISCTGTVLAGFGQSLNGFGTARWALGGYGIGVADATQAGIATSGATVLDSNVATGGSITQRVNNVSKLVVDVNGITIPTSSTPASAAATGTTGQIAWDSSYIYVCTATNTWKRVAIATW